MNEKFVIFIPQYILTALHARGIDFMKLSNSVDNIVLKNHKAVMGKFDRLNIEPKEEVFNLLSKHLSKYDIRDIIASNEVCRTEFNISDEDMLLCPSLYKQDSVDTTNIMSILVDETVDTKKVILSSNDNDNVNVPFILKVSETCIFIILQDSFFNFKALNLYDFKLFFLNILITFYLKVSDDSKVYSSSLFRTFNSLLYKSLRS